MNHIDGPENQSIFIKREVYSRFRNVSMLSSRRGKGAAWLVLSFRKVKESKM
jgi:hypothetical protein